MPGPTTVELLPEPGAPVTAEPVRPAVTPAEVAQPYRELADTLKTGAQASEDIADNFATQAGYRAVTMGPDGTLQLGKAPIIGEASKYFADAEKYAALAEGEKRGQDALVELGKEHPNDPQGFYQAAQIRIEKTQQQLVDGGAPDVGLALSRALQSTATYTYRSIWNQTQDNIRRNFDQSTRAVAQAKTQQLMDLIESGGINSPMAKSLVSEIHSALSQRVTNPILGESPDLLNLQLDDLDRQVRQAQFGYQVKQYLQNPAAPYRDTINAAAQKYGVNPTLLTRQIAQESGFNPAAVSGAGAAGIAQFMPDTAARYGVDRADPNSSIEGAAHYMSDLSRMFGGNTGLALAAYNWGEANVANWASQGANPQAMPAETRNYVKAITGLPIENWLQGERPSPLTIQALGAPGNMHGGVASAMALINHEANDESVDPTQRRLDVERGLAIIKDYRDDITRQNFITEQVQKQRDAAFEDSIIKDSASAQPQITENQIKTAQGVSPESIMRMLQWRKRDDMPEPMAQVSHTTSIDLFQRMNLPAGDPGRIASIDPVRDAYIAGSLTRADEEWLEKRFTDARSSEGARLNQIRTEFTKAVEPSIDKSNPMMGSIDQSGKLQAYAFQRYVDQRIDEYRKGGKSPFDLFDPAKPDYLGKPEVLKPFQRTMEQSAREMATRFGAALAPALPQPPQRKPGESVANYLARTQNK